MAPNQPNLTITPLTEDVLAKQLDRDNELEAGVGIEDQIAAEIDGEGGEGDQPRGQEQERTAPVQMSPHDQKRLDMANRFKRPGVETPFDGDMTKDENLYGDVAAETLDPDPDLPEPGVPTEQRAAPAERTFTVKVRGKDVVLTEAQLLERASKVEAADSYLAESREILDAAKQVRAGRSPDRQHPDDQNSAQDGEQDQTDHSTRTRHPAPDLKSVVEKIQFGDPDEAARDLGEFITTAATKQANEGHIARLVSNDLAKSKLDLKAFAEANPEIAADEIASSVIEQSIYKIYREEIKALGVDEAQIPKDPKALADWHRLYRVHGHTVSRPADVLQKAKATLEKFRGAPSAPKPAARKEAPRVDVNVNRTERRMAIPVQPARAVAPRRDAPPAVTQSSSRSDAVKDMRRLRGQPVS